MKRCAVLLSLLTLFTADAALAQQQTIVSTSRSIDWSTAGVPGGIPNRTTICATLNPGASGTQISNAIASCPSGQVVFLNAGTYNISGGIIFNNKSNVTLRGAGANQTFLVFSSANGCGGLPAAICLVSGDTNYYQQPSNTANWTGGYAKGTTSITLSGFGNLKVGNPLILDQLNDSSNGGQIYICDTDAGGCALDGPAGTARSGRAQLQIVTVTACGTSTPGAACTSGNVTISPGLYMPNWRSSQSPGAWWATNPILSDGVESLSMDLTASGGKGVQLFNCSGCWVKGVRTVNPGGSHVAMWNSPRTTIRDNYFFGPGGGQQSYGVEPVPSSDTLIENNIFQNIAAAQTINGPCSGCVVSYNFSINPNFTQSTNFLAQSITLHSTIDNLLAEGNVGVGIYADAFHGTHHFVTLFRNRYDGFEKNNGTTTSEHTNPIILYMLSRYFNIVGNVLGSTARPHNNYQRTPSVTSGVEEQTIYTIGYSTTGAFYPADQFTADSLMRWGNYDVATGTSRFDSTEVPSGLSAFANPVPGNQNLPASFYLPGRPAWWPAAKPWPAIGPDVTGGNIPNVGGHAYSIPAQDCYTNVMHGTADGTGGVLQFDASACYTTSGGAAPSAPQNLRIVVP